MKRQMFLLVLVLALAASSMAMAESTDSTDSVGQWFQGAVDSAADLVKTSGELEVRGNAVRTVAPDTATLRLGVSIDGKTEKEAQTQANAIINDVLAALRAEGIEDSQMATTGYNVTRKYNHSGKLSFADGYTARIDLVVKVQNFDQINTILDMAVEKGANNVGDIAFSHSDEGAIYREALKDAIRIAGEKAADMADAAGVTLHALLALRETSGYGVAYANAYTPMAYAETGTADTGTQIVAGDLEISASVTMLYQIK